MSNLPGNPHEGAVNFALGAAPKSDEDRLNLDAMATVQATLALAYEQRTANLLKVLELQARMSDAQQAFNLSAFDVAERLGIEPKPVSRPF